ncbi:MAG TPA: hypothetical protein VK203_07955 [Nostocaceae cyanobacterium]|nr:hypothetical protein [Nostocaceae cyanobacterium]
MITEQELAQQFSDIVQEFHPRVWELLRHCYVRVINPNCRRSATLGVVRSLATDFHYIAIYCPPQVFTVIAAEKDLLREVGKYLGLTEVVCFNASNILRDPLSRIKEVYPQLWLELIWIVTQEL